MDELTTEEAPVPQSAYPDPTQTATESRKALVSQLLSDVKAAEGHWEPKFERMRRDQSMARGKQWEELHPELSSDTYYVANITQRHVQQRVAALYAKNPKAIARRRPTIDYTVWDGNPDTIAKIQEQMAVTGQPDPAGLAILADFTRTMQRREVLERIARTMEIVYQYYTDEQVIPFKKQMKRLVRRALATGVGYVVMDFQRVMEMSAETDRAIADVTQQMARIERLAREFAAGDFDDAAAEYERLKLMLSELQKVPQVLAREGLVYEFPFSTQVIVDPRCRQLDGFLGADWVAVKYHMTPAQVKETYDVDLALTGYTTYVPINRAVSLYRPMAENEVAGDSRQGLACIYVVFHKRDGMAYVVCDGYPDFLREPSAPNVQLERFWPVFTLAFNECDSEEDIFPPSDVELLRHQQHEYNRARESLREHRRANRPKIATAAGRLSDSDKAKLESHPANAVLELEGLNPGEKIDDLLQPIKMPALDPSLYDTNILFEDFMRVGGSQEANLGGTSSSTATESSIAESSRLSSLSSNVDDLDELLTELARAGGQVLLMEVSQRTVREIAGDGAVWPDLSRDDIVKELYLEIEAGSSGRPNQAQQIQNFERVAPYLLQIPGIKPARLAQEALQRMDDKLDLSDWLDPALPSITAMNSAKQLPTPGDPEADPNAQGEEGVQNGPRPNESTGDTPGPGRPPMDPNIERAGPAGSGIN